MAKNTGQGRRQGEVKGREQTAGKGGWTKRDPTGKKLAGPKPTPFKGVRKVKGVRKAK